MIRTFIAAAALAGGLALSGGPATALPGRGDLAIAAEPAGVTLAQWDGRGRGWDRGERRWDRGDRGWRGGYVVRRGPPPWAPAWGRRYRDRGYSSYGYRRDYGYGRPRYYQQRPSFSLRF